MAGCIVGGFSEAKRVTKLLDLCAGAYIRKSLCFEKLGLTVMNELDRPA